MFLKKKKKNPENMKEMLSSFEELEKRMNILEERTKEMERISESTVQGVGIIRFNPFSNIGGDQSFSLALINGKKDGVVITSLYSQEGSSVYGKEIKGGVSKHSLSDEEKEAIKIALKEKKDE